jgi:antitoxin ParD1/3/4
MNVNLTPEMENIVSSKVASGMYNSASEVVREALRLMNEQDELKRLRLENLRAEIRRGIEASDRGEVFDGRKAMAEIKEELESFKTN